MFVFLVPFFPPFKAILLKHFYFGRSVARWCCCNWTENWERGRWGGAWVFVCVRARSSDAENKTENKNSHVIIIINNNPCVWLFLAPICEKNGDIPLPLVYLRCLFNVIVLNHALSALLDESAEQFQIDQLVHKQSLQMYSHSVHPPSGSSRDKSITILHHVKRILEESKYLQIRE